MALFLRDGKLECFDPLAFPDIGDFDPCGGRMRSQSLGESRKERMRPSPAKKEGSGKAGALEKPAHSLFGLRLLLMSSESCENDFRENFAGRTSVDLLSPNTDSCRFSLIWGADSPFSSETKHLGTSGFGRKPQIAAANLLKTAGIHRKPQADWHLSPSASNLSP